MKGFRQTAIVAIGFFLHAAILLPLLLLRGSLCEMSILLLLFGIALFYLFEEWFARRSDEAHGIVSHGIVSPSETTARSCNDQFVDTASRSYWASMLAPMTGVVLLSLFCTALTTGGKLGATAMTRDMAMICGGVLFLSGVALRCFAIVRLDRYFVSAPRVASGQALATDGVYRWMRHPSETGLLAIALGAAVMRTSLPAGVVWLVVLVPLVLVRVRLEERVLLAGFGDRYRQYAMRTAALLPLGRFGRR